MNSKVKSKQIPPELEAENGWTERSLLEMLRQNQDVTESIRSLRIFFQTTIEEATIPILLRLEENDRHFWHECIKHGIDNPSCDKQQLKKKWETQEAFFTANKIVDPLFERFNALFTDESINIEDVKIQFKILYKRLNQKICDQLKSRSQKLHDWICSPADEVENEGNYSTIFKFDYEDNNLRNIPICTGPGLDSAIKEVLRNALKHGQKKASIAVTDCQIVIHNDGELDMKKWKKSQRAQNTQRIWEEYHLNFELKQVFNGVNAVISWRVSHRTPLPVNAQNIVEGGEYA